MTADTRTTRRWWRWVALAMVAALVAGGTAWWLSRDKDARAERVAAVAGVRDVAFGEEYTQVDFDAGIGRTDLSRALHQVMSILHTDNSDSTPKVEATVGAVVFVPRMTKSYDQTAIIVTLVAAMEPTTVIHLPGSTDIGQQEGTDVLEATRAFLDDLADAGVDSLGIFGRSLEVFEGRWSEGQKVNITDGSVGDVQDRLARLARAISTSGATLDRAYLSQTPTIEVSVARHSEVAPARRALLDTFRGEQLELTVRVANLMITGTEDPTRAVRFAETAKNAGLQLTGLSADCSRVNIAAKGILDLRHVANLTRDPRKWLLRPNAYVTITPPEGTGRFADWMSVTDVRFLRNNLPMAEALWRAGYTFSYTYRADLSDDDRHVLGVAPLLNKANAPQSGDIADVQTIDKLVRILRTGRWPGTIRLEVHIFEEGDPPLVLSTTATGPVRELPEHPTTFHQKWNATAR